MQPFVVGSLLFITTIAASAADATRSTATPPDHELAQEHSIDQFVRARLHSLNISPAPICSDEVFLRRVYLDTIGTLPTPLEARGFLNDNDPHKRADLIDRLLERREFADYWSMKWGDLLRVKAEFPINLWPNAVQAYHRWIRSSLEQNMPYDQFVREMLTSSGSNFRVPQVNFYRAMQDREPRRRSRRAVALTFMGARSRKLARGTTGGHGGILFPARITSRPASGKRRSSSRSRCGDTGRRVGCLFPMVPQLPGRPDQDPREVFADWLDASRKSLVRPQYRQPHLVLAAGTRNHPRAGRISAGQSAEQSGAAGVPGTGIGQARLRSKAHLPVDL